MNPNVQANPSMMLPPSLLRGGQSNPGLFQQSPLSQNMSPSAMGGNPQLMQQPQAGSQANNPTMPAPQQQAGQQMPAGQNQQVSEAQYILQALAERLKHHSKITDKTVSTLAQMIQAGIPQPTDPQAGQQDPGGQQ